MRRGRAALLSAGIMLAIIYVCIAAFISWLYVLTYGIDIGFAWWLTIFVLVHGILIAIGIWMTARLWK